MLEFLLDEQISPKVAKQVHLKRPDIPIHSLACWQEGVLMGKADELVLQASTAAGLTLVTYDLKTIPSLLAEWVVRPQTHGGVILVDNFTLPPHDFGSLIRSLIAHWDLHHQEPWAGKIDYLRRV